MSTFVLVPGAWLGGWVWKKVTPLLQEKRHTVHTITLTGEGERVHLFSKDVGIETAIQDVLNVIKYNDLNNFVLVGHSFAGKVAAAVADRVPERVKMILYLDAERPEKGVREPQVGEHHHLNPRMDNGGFLSQTRYSTRLEKMCKAKTANGCYPRRRLGPSDTR